SAEDRKSRQLVTVKKYLDPFSAASKTRHIFREIKLLRHMKHENVAAVVDIFISPSQDVYLVTELMEINLQTLLKTKPMQGEFVQYFLYQIMRGLKYIHSAGVVHGDLQPSNIMVSHNCDLKIKGYGQPRVYGPWITRHASAHYTAPEAMLEGQRYGKSIDIWSVGCIFAELLQGKVLFPGQNDIQQFHMITELLGTPTETVTKRMTGGNLLIILAAGLLENMLVFDLQERVTASEALEFAYLAPYHDPTDEPEAEEAVDWTFDNANHSFEYWKAELYAWESKLMLN
ncbi:mitogen-activated protein kinase HOG1, partial [Penicillium waksmanii]|uniref:mitogen-activated protein kinase HOG1 n=1 Tax=Penicillium waksmanii TaxID=69791 RepID=UPI002546E72E